MTTVSGSISLDTRKLEAALATEFQRAVQQVTDALNGAQQPVTLRETDAQAVLWDNAKAGTMKPEEALFLARQLAEVGYAIVAVEDEKRAWFAQRYATDDTTAKAGTPVPAFFGAED